MKKSNGINVMGNYFCGIFPQKRDHYIGDLEDTYKFEHFEVVYPIFPHLVPFSNDGSGDFYCFDTSMPTENAESCAIVFWVSNYQYTPDDKPEITHNSFADWVQEIMIDWILEDYDYDGNEK